MTAPVVHVPAAVPVSRRLHRTRAGGFALVVTLLIVSLLAIVAVSFLASMSSERQTANAYLSKTRAEQAAQAGVSAAEAILAQSFRDYPDSATVWDPQQTANKDGSYNEGTSLYLRAVPAGDVANPQPSPSDPANPDDPKDPNGNNPNNPACKEFVLPLISGVPGGNAALVANKPSAFTPMEPPVADQTQQTWVDLNFKRSAGDTQGAIGSPPTWSGTGPKPARAYWVNLTGNDGSLVGRYAFWIDDESFRANVNYAGTGVDPAHDRKDNTGTRALTVTDLRLNATDLNLLGLLSPFTNIDPTTTGQDLVTTRQGYPGGFFPDALGFTHTADLSTSNVKDTVDKLRYLTTTQSAGLNLTRHGTQRLNLNAVVPQPSPLPSPVPAASPAAVQTQVNEIVTAIAFHAPNFGQRFYRKKWSGTPPVPTDLNSSDVATTHGWIYLNKIAANIVDYLDADSLPTVLNAPTDLTTNLTKKYLIGQVPNPNLPTKPFNYGDNKLVDPAGTPITNPIWAIGKDASPYMQEAAVRYTTSGATPSNANPTPTYTVAVDYYIQFWNMSTRQITGADLGPHPFIHIGNPPKWMGYPKAVPHTPVTLQDSSGHTLSDTRDLNPGAGDVNIDISQAIFPPGACTVITTDPNWQAAVPEISDSKVANQTEAAKHFVQCNFSSGNRVFTGIIPTGCSDIRVIYQSSTSSDYITDVVVGNNNGCIDGLEGAIAMSAGTISQPVGGAPRPVYGGYLRGNLASGETITSGGQEPSAVGDPRTNNEPLSYAYNAYSPADQSIYRSFGLAPSGYSPIKIAPNFGLPPLYSVDPAKTQNPWPDFYYYPGSNFKSLGNPAVMKAQDAPGVIANSALYSVGQLGDVFDPARLPSTSGGDVTLSRGGGRSLKIGQHDDLYDGVLNSASSAWAAWRLGDIFSTTDTVDQPGLININGLTRDNGAALQSALQGIVFQSQTKDPTDQYYSPLIHGDASLANNPFDAAGMQTLITDIINKRLKNTDPTKPGPFFERGEISETPCLNPANGSSGLFGSVNMKDVFDDGREELVRRLIEMTTTRGSVFTVYAVGQAIVQSDPKNVNTRHVTGTQRLRITFKLVPETSTGAPFHPGTDSSGKPTTFDPAIPQQVTNRFSKPDHFAIQVLSVGS